MSPSGNSFAYGTVLELSEIKAQMCDRPRFILEPCSLYHFVVIRKITQSVSYRLLQRRAYGRVPQPLSDSEVCLQQYGRDQKTMGMEDLLVRKLVSFGK